MAPSKLLKESTGRIKNDHRDSKTIAKLARMNALTKVWVPCEHHESIRDLVRARQAATKDLRQARQRIKSYLLRYHRHYDKKSWTYRHHTWLSNQTFELPAQQITFQTYLNAHEKILSRRDEIEQELRELARQWSQYSVVEALQALKGISFVIAVTVVAEIGDITRFKNPKELMAFLGMVPGEHSSGNMSRSRGITKTGNKLVRVMLYESAWNYTRNAKVGTHMKIHRPTSLSQKVIDISWKAQLRLHERYRKLISHKKRSQVAITAVARELVGFIWAIAQVAHGST